MAVQIIMAVQIRANYKANKSYHLLGIRYGSSTKVFDPDLKVVSFHETIGTGSLVEESFPVKRSVMRISVALAVTLS